MPPRAAKKRQSGERERAPKAARDARKATPGGDAEANEMETDALESNGSVSVGCLEVVEASPRM